MTLDDLQRFTAPLKSRVLNIVARALLKNIDDATKLQSLQLQILGDDDTHDDVERFQEYGFTSVPLADAEVVVVFPGGTRDHGLAIGVEDRRYRILNLASGEVAIYNNTGAKIVMKANGDIECTPKSGQKLLIVGDLAVSGTVEATGDVKAGAISLQAHTHSVPALTVSGTSPSGAVTGSTAPNDTGAPS